MIKMWQIHTRQISNWIVLYDLHQSTIVFPSMECTKPGAIDSLGQEISCKLENQKVEQPRTTQKNALYIIYKWFQNPTCLLDLLILLVLHVVVWCNMPMWPTRLRSSVPAEQQVLSSFSSLPSASWTRLSSKPCCLGSDKNKLLPQSTYLPERVPNFYALNK